MALIKCSECQKEVSDQAVSCPNCGNPIRTNLSADKKIDILKDQIRTLEKRKWEIFKTFFGF